MIRVEIVESLVLEIKKKFDNFEANKILDLFLTVEDNPAKGKILASIGGILIKELKYKGFRFYFLADGYKLKFFSEKELVDVLLRFVRMSDKKHQQQTIQEIKEILSKIGPAGLK